MNEGDDVAGEDQEEANNAEGADDVEANEVVYGKVSGDVPKG